MPRQGPPYSPRFRADAVRRLRSGGATVAELSRELGVSEQTLRRWRREAVDAHDEAAEAPTGEPNESPTAPAAPPVPSDSTPQRPTEIPGRDRPRLGPPRDARSGRRLAGLAAQTIEVGVAIVTVPAGWASRALRRYAER